MLRRAQRSLCAICSNAARSTAVERQPQHRAPPVAGGLSAESATPATPSTTETQQKVSEAQKEFLKTFREKLNADPELSELDAHIPQEDVAPARATPSAAAIGRLQRGVEPLPPWVKLHIPKGYDQMPRYNRIKASLKQKGLSTVCQEAKCPNIGECWGGSDGGAATATIMLMGSHCTRGCRFCSVLTSKAPPPLDPQEPEKTAAAVAEMGVDYIVLTMVDRDDLPDGGAEHVARCIRQIKVHTKGSMLVECLSGDYRGDHSCIQTMVNSGLDVYAHNIECVERITPNVRDRRAAYRQSLHVLEYVKTLKPEMYTKSSIMLGLGEEEGEVRQTLRDLRSAGVDFVTLGQYLQPSRTRLKVSRYAHPDEFAMWEKESLAMGFLYCASGPMVRSSYKAGEHFIRTVLQEGRRKPSHPASGNTLANPR